MMTWHDVIISFSNHSFFQIIFFWFFFFLDSSFFWVLLFFDSSSWSSFLLTRFFSFIENISKMHAMLQGFQGFQGGPPGGDIPIVDSSEMIHISSLSLLKMLKHGKTKQFQQKIFF